MLDFHIHLARLPLSEQLLEILKKNNYDCNCIACEPWEWEKASFLKPKSIAFGIHPMIASQISSNDFELLENHIQKNKHATVGECGLDKRYLGYNEGEIQEKVFLKQIQLALKYERNIQIHCVGDYHRIIKLLKQENYPPNINKANVRPIFHRFGGDLSIVHQALTMEAIFSLHASSFQKKTTIAAIPFIPKANVRFETDADETTFQAPNIENITIELKKHLALVKSLYYKLF